MKFSTTKTTLFCTLSFFFSLSLSEVIAQPLSHPNNHPESLVFNNESAEEITIPDNFFTNWNNVHVVVNRTGYSSLPENLPINLKEGNSEFVFPVKGQLLGQFCYRGKITHAGVDIALKKGTPVYSSFDGVVRLAKNYGGYGKLVVVRHLNGLETVYGHLSKIKVKVNQKVKAGDIVGLGGRTGRATANHLHFETRYNGAAFDPMDMMDFSTYDLKSDTLILTRHSFLPKFKIVRSRRHGKSAIEMNYDDEGKLISGVQKTEANSTQAIGAVESSDTIVLKENSGLAKNTKAVASISKSSKKSKYYSVKKGETLYQIAKINGTTAKNIARLNGISTKKKLKIGQKIRVR
ncbi:MAG: M23 family metallopeptidase [Bacteroidota bacterium]